MTYVLFEVDIKDLEKKLADLDECGVEVISQVNDGELVKLTVKCGNWAGLEETDSESEKVYLMSHANGLTKIGLSKNPSTREKTLQAEDPRLHLLWSMPGTRGLERRLHQVFNSLRVRGEWFDLKPHHIDWIASLEETHAITN